MGQWHIALAVGAGGGMFGHFFSPLSFLLFLPLWETARYRLKYCLKGPLNPKQPTNGMLVCSLLSITIVEFTSQFLLKFLLVSIAL